MENKFLALKENINEAKELYMTFSLSDRNYAIIASDIIEIIQLPSLISLEQLPENIAGLLNLRGKIISVIDIRNFLGIKVQKYSIDNQVLIVNINNNIIGIIVDSVKDVIPFDYKNIESIPYERSKKYLKGIYNFQDKIIAFLDLETVIKELDKISFEATEVKQLTCVEHSLLPVDDISTAKLNKRALALQKEIRVDIDKHHFIKDKFVSFSLNKEVYCLSLKYVKEFTKLKNINLTLIPCVPAYIRGLINIRGEFITIIDIKHFLQIQQTSITDKTKIIVVKTEGVQIGLLVDEVFDIVNIPVENLRMESSSSFEKDKFTIGEIIRENNSVMSILNLERLLKDERLYIEDAI